MELTASVNVESPREHALMFAVPPDFTPEETVELMRQLKHAADAASVWIRKERTFVTGHYYAKAPKVPGPIREACGACATAGTGPEHCDLAG